MNKIEVVNLVPKFLNFFELANHEDVKESERWSLWKEHYNFAAFPPGYDQQARKQWIFGLLCRKSIPVMKKFEV